MTKPREKTREELQAEIEDGKKKIQMCIRDITGGTLPGMKPLPPFQVIYQTAEDGLCDTVKPRLMEAEADLDRVLVIDESKQGLSLSDERIEMCIRDSYPAGNGSACPLQEPC